MGHTRENHIQTPSLYGKRGIRTLGTLLAYTPLAGEPRTASWVSFQTSYFSSFMYGIKHHT